MASLYGNDSDECREMHCEECYEFGETAVAEGFCKLCMEFLCRSCIRYHKRHKPHHRLTDRASMPQEFCFERCSDHQKFIRFFCSKCETFACSECRQTNHAMCTNMNHVSTMAIAVEESNELKDVLKDINLITDSLQNVSSKLECGITDIETKVELAQKTVEQSSRNRKSLFVEQQQMCTETFEKYHKDVISVIEDEKERTVARLRKEQSDLDAKLKCTENEKLQQLGKTSNEEISVYRSLLVRSKLLLGVVKSNYCDLNQKMKLKQRCRLLIAMKKTSFDIKQQKQDLQTLTDETAALKMNSVPDQIINDAESYQASISSKSKTYAEIKNRDYPSEVLRKSQVYRCSNTECRKDSLSKFCPECGHKTIPENRFGITLTCSGKLEDGQKCNFELIPGQNFCMNCGVKVEKPVKQLLEQKLHRNHSLEDELKYVNPKTTSTDTVHLIKFCVAKDDEMPKMRLLKLSNSLKSELSTELKSCFTKMFFSLQENQVSLLLDAGINEESGFDLAFKQLERAEATFHNFLNDLVIKDIHVPQNEWYTVEQKLRGLNVSDPERVLVFTSMERNSVRIVGDKTLIDDVAQVVIKYKT